ncbi:cyclase family protein [Robertkochia marina]|uniref:Cyclase family protein n=1 Tax=Robertkochia marina TaxID=1227945 RepID=A0A4S3M1X9_9FLAO|nr:cyclase family protein [Robertkochia marina]THD69066.1 cyclase family protein [Robertkochia marina]TRZ44890.1 cyclase family protein [Robertkochia marina]
MKTLIEHPQGNLRTDLSKPIDISLPLKNGAENPNAWYVPPPEISPVKDGDFTGSVAAGSSTNFNNVFFNPHAHGTHTECVGHISKEFHSVNRELKTFFFLGRVITVAPEARGEDLVISKDYLAAAWGNDFAEAIIIRTLPNDTSKKTKQYSHTNPPYLEEAAAKWMAEKGIKHLLIDLPSVDKEKDDGKLLAHKAFWNYPEAPRKETTITEFIYVPDSVEDGLYLLNLQIASFENDASPSKPVLYRVEFEERV